MAITVKITIAIGPDIQAEQEFPVYLAHENLSLTAQHAISAAAAKFGVYIPEFKQVTVYPEGCIPQTPKRTIVPKGTTQQIEGHQKGCICADCSGAELTSEND
jgi:hypothetical protein